MTRHFFAVVGLAAILVTSAAFPPAAQASEETQSITLRVDPHPAKPNQARAERRRIETAAMEVCGASPSSLRELQLAVRHSDCYRKALDGALRQIGDPAFASR
jgi:UrcA family protein